MSSFDKEKLNEIIEEKNKLNSSQKELDDLSNLSSLNNSDGEILEDLKIEDSFLNEIFFNDSLDSNSNIIYASEESPIFNEKSYLENLPNNDLVNDEIYASEENPIFNEKSYYDNLSLKKDVLQSDIYKEQLFVKEETNFDDDKKVVFDEIVDENTYLSMQINDTNQQVIFDEIIIDENKEDNLNYTNDEPQDLFDFELVDESKNVEVSSDEENDSEIIQFEQPPFEEYTLEDDNSKINEQEAELPIINVDEEISNLLDDIDYIEPTEHYEISFDEFKNDEKANILEDDIQIEYVPSNEYEDFVLVDNKENEHEFIELSKEDFDIYKGVEIIDTTDEVKGMFQDFVAINDDITNEFGDVEIIDTNDHVESIDYSGYSIASYIQPEIIEEPKLEVKNNEKISNEYLNVETIYPGEIPSWYSKPIQPIVNDEINTISQPKLVLNDKETISKTSDIPSIEEQLKKIKKPNLFRKYTVASTANLVILKSIDRLLNLTNSVIERQKNK